MSLQPPFSTANDALAYWERCQPDKPAVTWLDGNGDPQQTHTYRSLTEARVLGRHWKQDFNTR